MEVKASAAISVPIPSVETDPKLRRAIEIIIELCYRFRRDKDRPEEPAAVGEAVIDG